MLGVPGEEMLGVEGQEQVPFLDVCEVAEPLPGSLRPPFAAVDCVQSTPQPVASAS